MAERISDVAIITGVIPKPEPSTTVELYKDFEINGDFPGGIPLKHIPGEIGELSAEIEDLARESEQIITKENKRRPNGRIIIGTLTAFGLGLALPLLANEVIKRNRRKNP